MTIRLIACAAAIGSAFAFLSGPTQAAPQPSPVTPELSEAAKKEGKIVCYTAIDIKVAQYFGI
jgi:iron(III) transport system substrate-binding protein